MTMLDDRDKRLIAALQKNARASLISLARDIGLSRSATHDRVLRLEERGIVSGYTAIINAPQLAQARAFFAVTFKPGVDMRVLATRIAKIDNVSAAHCLAGEMDVLVEAAAESAGLLNLTRTAIAALDGVLEVKTHTILETRKP